MKRPTTEILSNLQGGTRQRGGDWTTSNTVNLYLFEKGKSFINKNYL